MWRMLGESVAGTSHTARAAPCQDAHAVLVVENHGPVLLVAVADGAGSARFAEVGANATCRILIDEAQTELLKGAKVSELNHELLVRWLLAAKAEIYRLAEERGVRPRELACTAILAIVSEDAAAFAQVGDGAIVVAIAGGYEPVFWPTPGEYANVTEFLTDDGIEDRIVSEVIAESIYEVAVLSDGLQRLALDYTTRRGHSGFFSPLLTTLRDHPDPALLGASLRAFLDSAQVNARTDDDKTLVLATRLPPCPRSS